LALDGSQFVPRKNEGFAPFFVEKGSERILKCTGVNMVCVSRVALIQRSVCDRNENIEVFP
jgi:hypothetical protein